MKRMKSTPAVIIATIYVLLLTITGDFAISLGVSAVLYLLFPMVLVWTVYAILKDTSKPYPELKGGEEWGYSDVDRDRLGMF